MARFIAFVLLLFVEGTTTTPLLQGSPSSSPTLSSTGPSPTSINGSLTPEQETELYDLHEKLVDIPSTTPNDTEASEFVETYVKELGYFVERVNVSDSGRFNVFAYPQELQNKGEWPEVLITSHLDTVPPHIPFERREKNGSIYHYGRGTVDAKGCVAAQIIAAHSFFESRSDTPSLGFLYVVGEEVDGAGMKAFAEYARNVTFRAAIFGEPTEGNLASGHKGGLGVTIQVKGKAAHSGYPWLGVSAIDWLVGAVAVLKNVEPSLPDSELLGNSTVNVGVIRGGVASNIVPEDANASTSIRVAEGSPYVVRDLVQEALNPLVEQATAAGAVFNVTFSSEPSFPQYLDTDVPGLSSAPMFYGTDIPSLPQVEKRYLYGASTIQIAHTALEEISQDELVQATLAYGAILEHLFPAS